MTERAIERGFPIVRLNPIAARDQKSKRAIYQMHNWYARRSESTFRALLLGAAIAGDGDDGPVDLMNEFYKGHADDERLRRSDGGPLRVLDPFMGGGTTVVEALRLGLDVTGVDYNPIPWFIVRGETTKLDIAAFDSAFERVAEKVRSSILDMYTTRCPLTGKEAHIIYAFWVKEAACTAPSCGTTTALFKGYEVGRKRGDCSLRYYPDVSCPCCERDFDWELDRCSITAGAPQISGDRACGKGRPADHGWAAGIAGSAVDCPYCARPVPISALSPHKNTRTKKVPLHVLIDPTTGDFFEVRGDIPERVEAPVSGHQFRPADNVVAGGKFSCAGCGQKQDVVSSARGLGRALPFRLYGFYAWTPHGDEARKGADELGLTGSNDKWFGAATNEDHQKVVDAAAELKAGGSKLPLPSQEIHDGYNTNRLVIHQYKRWSDVYGPRQLLALSRLLNAIGEEPDGSARDALLGAFQNTLDFQSNLARYSIAGNKVEAVTAGHDYRNPTTAAETSPFGVRPRLGRGTFVNYVESARRGLAYGRAPTVLNEKLEEVRVPDVPSSKWAPTLIRGSAADIPADDGAFDLIVTDPPYAGSVQYAEMSDWSYVWLHQVLKSHYPDEFGSDITLKAQEIIEDGDSKDAEFFFEHLGDAWRECHRVLVDDGLLVFTFHHKEGDRWSGLLRSLFEAGFYLVAAYPTHSEALSSIVIQATKGITYDIVHVCRKRLREPENIPWSRLRRQVVREARAQLRLIEAESDVLPGPDVQMILLGKALRLFSLHYGQVLDNTGQPMDLDEAMQRILLLVREVRGEQLPLPESLQEVDSLSQVALLHIVGRGPWSRDDLHKELRGYSHGLEALSNASLVREVAGRRGELEAVPPVERAEAGNPVVRVDGPLVDKLGLLLAQVHAGKPVLDLMTRWRGTWAVIGVGGLVDP